MTTTPAAKDFINRTLTKDPAERDKAVLKRIQDEHFFSSASCKHKMVWQAEQITPSLVTACVPPFSEPPAAATPAARPVGRFSPRAAGLLRLGWRLPRGKALAARGPVAPLPAL